MLKLEDVVVWTDIHLGHRRIVDFCKETRPYAVDVKNPTDEEIRNMDTTIIKSWNEQADGKIIYFLGDFTFSRDKVYNQWLFDQLKGEKHLIKGNHDHRHVRSFNWASVQDYKEISVEDRLFIMSHYPMSSWKNMIHGSIHLYGHVHGLDVPGKHTLRMLEPSIDNGYPTPLTLREVVDKVCDRPITNPPIW